MTNSEDTINHHTIKEALYANEMRYRNILDDQTDLVCRYDINLNITFANRAYCTAFNVKLEDIIGKTFLDKIPEDQYPIIGAYMDSLTPQNPLAVSVHKTIMGDGTIRWFEWKDRALMDENGKIIEYQAIGRDITEQKQAQEALFASEKKYRQMFELLGLPKLIIDPTNLKIVDANPIAVTLYGDIVKTGTVYDINIAPPTVIDQATSSAIEESKTSFEMAHRFADGSIHTMEAFTALIEMEGKPFLYVILTDVTDKKHMQTALEEANALLEQRVIERTAQLQRANNRLEIASQRLELATMAGDIGIWDWNLITNELVWDDRMYAMYGFDKATFNLSIDSWTPYVHPDDMPRLQASMETLFGTLHRYDVEFRIIRPDKSIRYIQSNALIIRTSDGKAERLVGVNMDITDVKLAEEALLFALERETELGNLKSRFVSMASHEFRTPLSAIMAITESLTIYRDKMTSEQIDERLNKIRFQVTHLKDMMEDVLDLARLQPGRIKFVATSADFDALCRDIIEEFDSQEPYRGQIIYTCPATPILSQFDMRLMRQALTNLISNAIKYSPNKTPVWVELTTHEAQISIIIRDEGIGIPATDIKRLFEPFHRATNVGTIAGTGLGLSIAKQAIELHGGNIAVDSQVGVGTTFTILLPKNSIEDM
ncbi:MAG: PAS domain S-box protein [bacterium]|nr:PAS domain S-box protein [bacterium]